MSKNYHDANKTKKTRLIRKSCIDTIEVCSQVFIELRPVLFNIYLPCLFPFALKIECHVKEQHEKYDDKLLLFFSFLRSVSLGLGLG